MFFASNRHQSLAAKELGDADDAQHHRGIVVDAKPGTRPGKHTKSYEHVHFIILYRCSLQDFTFRHSSNKNTS